MLNAQNPLLAHQSYTDFGNIFAANKRKNLRTVAMTTSSDKRAPAENLILFWILKQVALAICVSESV